MVIPSDKLFRSPLRSILRMDGEKHMREAGSKVGAVSMMMSSRLWCVDILTTRTIDFHHRFTGNIRKTDWQTGLIIAVNL